MSQHGGPANGPAPAGGWQQQSWQQSPVPEGAPVGPPPEPPRRGRAGLWFALACAVTVVLLLLVSVTGGVIYLATRSGPATEEPSEPQLATFEHETFSLDYPETWFVGEIDAGNEDAGVILELRDESIDESDYEAYSRDELVIYLYSASMHAKSECTFGAVWIGFSWDRAEDPEELEDQEIGGRALPAQRVVGRQGGQDVIGEMYCADVDGQVMQIVVESNEATEISAPLREILASWRWADEDEG